MALLVRQTNQGRLALAIYLRDWLANDKVREMVYNRLASLVVAAGYLVAATFMPTAPAGGMITFVLAVLFPLPFIWFSEALGDFAVPTWTSNVNRPTSGIVMAIAAWMVLIGMPLLLLLYAA